MVFYAIVNPYILAKTTSRTKSGQTLDLKSCKLSFLIPTMATTYKMTINALTPIEIATQICNKREELIIPFENLKNRPKPLHMDYYTNYFNFYQRCKETNFRFNHNDVKCLTSLAICTLFNNNRYMLTEKEFDLNIIDDRMISHDMASTLIHNNVNYITMRYGKNRPYKLQLMCDHTGEGYDFCDCNMYDPSGIIRFIDSTHRFSEHPKSSCPNDLQTMIDDFIQVFQNHNEYEFLMNVPTYMLEAFRILQGLNKGHVIKPELDYKNLYTVFQNFSRAYECKVTYDRYGCVVKGERLGIDMYSRFNGIFDTAYQEKCRISWEPIAYQFQELLPEIDLTVCGDIASNPGPFMDYAKFSFSERNDNYVITMLSGFKFEIEKSKVVLTSNGFKFVDITVHEIQTKMGKESSNIDFDYKGDKLIKSKKRQINRSTNYSNHLNYDPFARCSTVFCKRFKDCYDIPIFDHFKEEGEGAISKYGPFLFIPTNFYGWNFNKNYFPANASNVNFYNTLLSSMSGQSMTDQQICDSILILTQLKITYFDLCSHPNDQIALFKVCFDVCFNDLSRYVQIRVPRFEIWKNLISRNTIIIPTRIMKFFNKKLLMKRQLHFLDIKYDFDSIQEYCNTNFNTDIEKLSDEQIMNHFNSGSIVLYTRNNPHIRWRSYKVAPYISEQPENISDIQSIAIFYTKYRMYDANLFSCFRSTLDYTIKNYPHLFRQIALKLANIDYKNLYYPGIIRLFNKLKMNPIDHLSLPYQKHEKVQFYREDNNKHIFELAISMEAEYKSFLAFISYTDDRNRFLTLEWLEELCKLSNKDKITTTKKEDNPNKSKNSKDTVVIREATGNAIFKTPHVNAETIISPPLRDIPEKWDDSSDAEEEGPVSSPPEPEIEQDKEENQGFCSYIKKKIGKMIPNSITSIPSSIDELTSKIETVKQDFIQVLQGKNLPKMASALSDLDFASFSSGYESLKQLINSFFTQFVQKITDFMSINIDVQFDFTKLLFYYIVWIKTDDKKLRTIIIIDLLVTMGVIDMVFGIIKIFIDKVKSMGSYFKKETGFQEEINKIYSSYDSKVQSNQETISQIHETVEQVETQTMENHSSILESFLNIIETKTPVVLGLLASSTILYLGFDSFKMPTKDVGKKIIESFRNVSYISAGITALPKVYDVIFMVYNYCLDHIKSIFKRDHKTVLEKHRVVREWLTSAVYCENITPKLLTRDVGSILGFFKDHVEMQRIKLWIFDVKDYNLQRAFTEQRKLMEKLYPIARSAARILLGGIEPFHVQLYSQQSGIGKTDVNAQIVKVVRQVIEEEANLIRHTLGLEPNPSRLQSNDLYVLQDNLDHCDMYYGQTVAIQDESNITNQVEVDEILMKMNLFSGNPVITKQADLSSKGRMFELECVISNTNNAFTQPDGLLRPDTLWRRRLLFEVKVKDKYCVMDNNSNSVMILDNAIVNDGLNRTLGQHLVFSMADPVTQGKPVNDAFVNLEIDQFKELIRALFKKHIATEEERHLTKDSMACYLRHRLVQIYGEVEKLSRKTNIDSLEKLNSALGAMKADIDKPRYQFIDDKEKFIRKVSTLVQDVANIQPFLDAKHDGAVELLLNNKKATSITEERFAWVKEDRRYRLEPSDTTTIKVKKGIFDKTLFKWDVHNNIPELKEHGVDGEDTKNPINAYVLLNLQCCYNKNHFEKILDNIYEQMLSYSLYREFKHQLSTAHYNILRMIGSTTSWIMNNIVIRVGKIFIRLGVIGFAIMSTFKALSALGQLLTPSEKQQTSYNQQRYKGTVPGFTQTGYLQDNTSDVSLAAKCVYRFYVSNEFVTQRCVSVGLGGNLFLANRHVFNEFKGEFMVCVFDPNSCTTPKKPLFEIKYLNQNNLSYIEGTDCVIVELKGFRPVREIRNKFMTEEELADNMMSIKDVRVNCVTIRDSEDTATDIYGCNLSEKQLLSTGYSQAYYNHEIEFGHERNLRVEMDFKIKPGDSGSLAFHDNDKVSKILGINLGTSDLLNSYYVGVISREQIYKACKKFDPLSRVVVPEIVLDKLPTSHKLHKVFNNKNALFLSPIKNQDVSSTIGFKKTKLFDHFNCELEPAIQHESDTRIIEGSRHFLEVSLNKSFTDCKPSYNLREERFMKEILKAAFIKFIPAISTVRVLDTKTAITGSKTIGSSSMDTSTCAGLMYKLDPDANGKRKWINYSETNKTWNIHPIVYHDVDYYEEHYKNLMVPINYKLEFRKKELVTKSKIENPKTRTVGTGNLIHSIIYSKIFKDMYTIVKRVWEKGGSSPFAIGLDLERHADQVVKHLKYTDYVIDFDVKSWETVMNLDLMRLTKEVKISLINDAYASRKQKPPEKIEQIANGLLVDYMSAYVVFADIVYQKRTGLLSGHPGTACENSEVHLMLLCLVVYRILYKYKKEWANPHFVLEHVRFIMMADDVQIALSPLIRQYVTIKTLAQGYKELGLEVTAADKSDLLEAKDITQSQFLKSSYIKQDNGFYTCRPNRSIVDQLLSWIRTDSKLSLEEQFKVNIENAMRKLYFRGREEYEQTRQTVNMLLIDINLSWSLDYDCMGETIGLQHAMQQQRNDDLDEELFDRV